MKILAIGDSTSNIYLMKKFAKNIEIHIIDFPKKGVDKTTTGKDGIEYFDSSAFDGFLGHVHQTARKTK